MTMKSSITTATAHSRRSRQKPSEKQPPPLTSHEGAGENTNTKQPRNSLKSKPEGKEPAPGNLWKPIIVGEREGEPRHKEPAATNRTVGDNRHTLRLPSPARNIRRPHHIGSPSSSTTHLPQDPPAQVAHIPDPDPPLRTHVPHSGLARPTINHTKDEPERAKEAPETDKRSIKAEDLESGFSEITWRMREEGEEERAQRLEILTLLLQGKRVRIAAGLRMIQQMRLALEDHYMARIKEEPGLLGREGAAEEEQAADERGVTEREAAVDEEADEKEHMREDRNDRNTEQSLRTANKRKLDADAVHLEQDMKPLLSRKRMRKSR